MTLDLEALKEAAEKATPTGAGTREITVSSTTVLALIAELERLSGSHDEKDLFLAEDDAAFRNLDLEIADLKEALAAEKVAGERMREAAISAETCLNYTREQFVLQGPAFIIRKAEAARSVPRQALAIPEGASAPGIEP